MPEAESVRALVSVHDVMPETLPQVLRLLTVLESAQVAPVTLLVVPGRDWSARGIATLRGLKANGCRIAGHGWTHRVDRYRGLYHRLHAAFVSRDVAEHLALDASGISALILRCHRRLSDQGLGPIRLYVPPAWALGGIAHAALAETPFDQYELLGGILCARTGRLIPLPLLGYEADRSWRANILRPWNGYNRRRALEQGWIRIGIHPHDLDLALAGDLRADLQRYQRFADYGDLEPGLG